MKARIKATGTIVEVEGLFDVGTALVNGRYFKEAELDFFDNFETIDWEQRRYELAKAAMQGVLSNPAFCGTYSKREAPIIIALDCADNMIKKLKRE